MTNSADPDQLVSSEANRSGSTLFAKTGHVVFNKRRVNINGLTKHDSHTNADTRMTITSLSVPFVLITINCSRPNILFFFIFQRK